MKSLENRVEALERITSCRYDHLSDAELLKTYFDLRAATDEIMDADMRERLLQFDKELQNSQHDAL